jgi:hypothetical protein
MPQSLFIGRPKYFDWGISIAEGLKIGEITHRRIFAGEKPDSFQNLTCNILFGTAIIRVKTLVVAIRASAAPTGAIPVRTGKSGIQGNFLYTAIKFFPEPGRIIVVSFFISPWEFPLNHQR